jgi:excisionase family DNA binding protein
MNFPNSKYPEGYTLAEVADILGKTKAYIWILVRQKRIKAKKVGRDFRVHKNEVEFLLLHGVRPIE